MGGHDMKLSLHDLRVLALAALLAGLISWNPADPSLNVASGEAATNWLGGNGAVFADLFMQSLGLGAWPAAILPQPGYAPAAPRPAAR